LYKAGTESAQRRKPDRTVDVNPYRRLSPYGSKQAKQRNSPKKTLNHSRQIQRKLTKTGKPTDIAFGIGSTSSLGVRLKNPFLSYFSVPFIAVSMVGCGAAKFNENQLQSSSTPITNNKKELSQSSEQISAQRKKDAASKESTEAKRASSAIEKRDMLSKTDERSAMTESGAAPRVAAASAKSPAPVVSKPEAPAVPESPQAALERQAAEFRQRITFVDLTYRACLGRSPDSAGLVHWSNLIATKAASFDQVQAEICAGSEGQIAKAYRDLLGRYPDPAGRTYWLEQLKSGRLSIEQIRQYIGASDERRAFDVNIKIESLRAQIAVLEKERNEIASRLRSI
jgi:hypothetical protein